MNDFFTLPGRDIVFIFNRQTKFKKVIRLFWVKEIIVGDGIRIYFPIIFKVALLLMVREAPD